MPKVATLYACHALGQPLLFDVLLAAFQMTCDLHNIPKKTPINREYAIPSS